MLPAGGVKISFKVGKLTGCQGAIAQDVVAIAQHPSALIVERHHDVGTLQAFVLLIQHLPLNHVTRALRRALSVAHAQRSVKVRDRADSFSPHNPHSAVGRAGGGAWKRVPQTARVLPRGCNPH